MAYQGHKTTMEEDHHQFWLYHGLQGHKTIWKYHDQFWVYHGL
jgi:hypothetical protein